MDSIAIEDARVRAAMDFYLLDLEGTAPKNTVKNYAPKQAEWKNWCASNWPPIPKDWVNKKLSWPPGQQLPGDLVDEGKLLLFMREEGVTRAPKKVVRVTRQR